MDQSAIRGIANSTSSKKVFNLIEFRGIQKEACLESHKKDKLILRPFNHMENGFTINVFVYFVKAMNVWLDIPKKKVDAIVDTMRVMNYFGFLCDDIQDNTTLRGGNPAAHLIYGIPLTMKTVNYLGFMVLDELKKLEHPKAIQIGYEYLLAVFRGQGLEVYWRDHHLCPSEIDYMMMSVDKSSSTFMFMVRLMQLFSKNQTDFNHFGNLVGLFLQIRDDYCNFWSAEYEKSKGFCEDLTEGKFNFPIIMGVHRQGNDSEVLKIVKKRPKDLVVKQHCISILNELGISQSIQKLLDYLSNELDVEAKILGSNLKMTKLLESFKDWESIGSLIQ